MALPTHQELLAAEFAKLKGEAQSLVSGISEAASSQYTQLALILPKLQEYAMHFGEPLSFKVAKGSGLALKAAVIQAIGPSVTEEQ